MMLCDSRNEKLSCEPYFQYIPCRCQSGVYLFVQEPPAEHWLVWWDRAIFNYQSWGTVEDFQILLSMLLLHLTTIDIKQALSVRLKEKHNSTRISLRRVFVSLHHMSKNSAALILLDVARGFQDIQVIRYCRSMLYSSTMIQYPALFFFLSCLQQHRLIWSLFVPILCCKKLGATTNLELMIYYQW